MEKLSKKQEEILIAINSYFSQYSSFPTLESIGKLVNLKSRAGVHYQLEQLKKKGLLKRDLITKDFIFKESLNFTIIPVLGKANAGLPLIIPQENMTGELYVDSRIIKNYGNLFAVKISGDSMNQQSIRNLNLSKNIYLEDGNYAIIDKNGDYREGDVVLAVINDCATIKILKRSNTTAILMPNSSNQSNHPIFIKNGEEMFINGKVILALEKPNA